jgi:hypothetical protein
MTLEEAIQQLETDVNSELDHTQVLEWLQELKRVREYVRGDIENKKKELEAEQRVLRMQLAFSQF